jgi:hypothetical protein
MTALRYNVNEILFEFTVISYVCYSHESQNWAGKRFLHMK